MNSRERVTAALQRIETDRVPIGEIGGGYTESIIQELLGDEYRTGPDAYFYNHVHVRQLLGADIMGARIVGPPVTVTGIHPDWGTDVFRDFWGASHTQPPESTIQLVHPIATTPEELDKAL